ncbi:MAG: hypothetical protein WBP43_05125 [Chitinophagales bacterium]|nr:hypothetical protein [Bacteroidota bacterium]
MDKKNKIAEITLLFWLMKVVSTTLGETLGDYLSMTLNLGYLNSLFITLIIFLVVAAVQVRLNQYIPIVFWFVIISTTTLGTEISDFLDRTLHLGYTLGSFLLLLLLLLSLLGWFKKYQSLAVFPITDKIKECYFWIVVLFSNSLGTAFGDFLGDYLGLSYVQGAIITACIILFVYILHNFSKVNHILLFWIAFIFTRPFGATFGDLLTKPQSKGGMALGTLNATLAAATILLVLIVVAHLRVKWKLQIKG